MNDLTKMSVGDLIAAPVCELTKVNGLGCCEVKHELARRLREQEQENQRVNDKAQDLSDSISAWEDTVNTQEKRAEQAEAALEQMTARCAELVTLLHQYEELDMHKEFDHDLQIEADSCQHCRFIKNIRKTISNLPASVEKLLAIKRAAELLRHYWLLTKKSHIEHPQSDEWEKAWEELDHALEEKP